MQCLDRAQYYGFAQPDCYIRLPDGSPLWNFVKAQVSIWVQMVLVIAIGVTCSTLVNGPVAMLFTVSFIMLGFFRQFFVDVATGKQVGGGPVESLVRLVTQRNQMTPIDRQLRHAIDARRRRRAQDGDAEPDATCCPISARSARSTTWPTDSTFPLNQLAQDLTIGLAYVVGLCIIGYFFLRTREVAK